MKGRAIPPVEDNPDGELLMMRALKKNNVAGEVVVARDGIEALEYLYAYGRHAGREGGELPRLIPTSPNERRDMIGGHGLGAGFCVRKPVDSEESLVTMGQLKRYRPRANGAPPEPAPG